jgi:hypothetical protein
VATEAGFDGGNVKASINGGAFTAVPRAAFVFNAPTTLATAAAGNTNPLAGQPGFTGTDGGENKGSWGTSQVDLAAAGVKAGDTVQLRFDIGRDGCGGVDGWYIDNVSITVCKTAVALTAAHTPEPVTAGSPSSIDVTAARTADTVGGKPTGLAVLRGPSGAIVAQQALDVDGRTSFALPATLPAGVSTYRVDYQGDDTFGASSVPVTVTVKAGPGTPVPPTPGTGAASTTKATSPGSVAKGRSFTAKVKVRSTTVPTGRVTITADGKTVGTGTLSGGKVKITLKTGRYDAGDKVRFTATYAGSATVATSKDTFTVRILRRR